MKLQTFSYFSGKGWTLKSFPDLDSPQTLVLAFGAPEYINSYEPLSELQSHFKNSLILGCSTSGEIHQTKIADQSISIAVAQFDKTNLKHAYAEIKVKDSFGAGQKIATELNNQSKLKAILLLSDGINVNGSELLRGINSVIPEGVTVTGGLAGDGDRFKETWVLKNGKPSTGIISAVGLYGDHVRIGHGSKGGWDIFGIERKVTRSEGNVLYELDGKPALQLYKEYLGDRASGLPATALLFPLALRKRANDKKSLVRTILSVDEKKQSMTFAGDIPQGYVAQLMRANFNRLIDGASGAASMIKAAQSTGSTLVVAISCVGRRLVLGERTEEEVEATLEVLPKDVKQVGFYSYGEISPYASGRCDLHNQTMTLTTITEE